jgi:hypothetical protein
MSKLLVSSRSLRQSVANSLRWYVPIIESGGLALRILNVAYCNKQQEESAFKLIKKLDLTGERAVRSRNFRDHKEVSRAAQRERSSSTMDPADFNKYMDRMVGTEVKGKL